MIDTVTRPTNLSDNKKILTFDDFLPVFRLYKKSYIISAFFQLPASLRLKFGVIDEAFLHQREPYLNRPLLMLVIAQASFLLGGQLALLGKLTPSCWDDYIRLLTTPGAITSRWMRIRFRHFVENKDGIQVQVSADNIGKADGLFVIPLSFSINEGACTGIMDTVLKFNSSGD